MARRLYITNRQGVEVEIRTPRDLELMLAQMTPEELQTWKDRYRFAPILNRTGNPNYTGTGRDLA